MICRRTTLVEYFSIMFTTLAFLAAVAGHIISRILVLALAIVNHLIHHIHNHNNNNHTSDNHTDDNNEEDHDKQAHQALPAAHHGDLQLEHLHHIEQDSHHDQAD